MAARSEMAMPLRLRFAQLPFRYLTRHGCLRASASPRENSFLQSPQPYAITLPANQEEAGIRNRRRVMHGRRFGPRASERAFVRLLGDAGLETRGPR